MPIWARDGEGKRRSAKSAKRGCIGGAKSRQIIGAERETERDEREGKIERGFGEVEEERA